MFLNLSLRPEYSPVKIKENQIKVWKFANGILWQKKIHLIIVFCKTLNPHDIHEGTCDACVTVYLNFSLIKYTIQYSAVGEIYLCISKSILG